MPEIRICPLCGALAHYSYYFQKYICSNPKCRWTEKYKEH